MHGPEAASSTWTASKRHDCQLQELKGCWPIKDTRQQKEYRKVSANCFSSMYRATMQSSTPPSRLICQALLV